MAGTVERLQRLFLGSLVDRRQVRSLALSKRRALGLFGSDGVSSVAYAPDEIVMMLALAGSGALIISPWVGAAIALVLLVVIGTYRYNLSSIAEGGDYELVNKRLGARTGVAVGASLMVDFMLTVTVSLAVASSYILSAFPALRDKSLWVTAALIVLVMLLCLRGLTFLKKISYLPLLLFLIAIGFTITVGYGKSLAGTLGQSVSSNWQIVPEQGTDPHLAGAGLFLLLARTFSSGAVALTGVSTMSNSVRFFERPTVKNASSTLMSMGIISAILLTGVLYLVKETGVRTVMDVSQLRIDGKPVPEGFYQQPVLMQMAETIYDDALMPTVLMLTTVAILIMAATTAFTGFPLLTAAIAEKGYLPVQLRAQSSPTLFAKSVILLGVCTLMFITLIGADLNTLIQMYIVGVFFSMTMTQAAIIKVRARELKFTLNATKRVRLIRPFIVTLIGFTATALALGVVILTKFTQGAWVTLILILVLSKAMLSVRNHYDSINQNLELPSDSAELAQQKTLPARVHAVVFVQRVRKPLMRAISYARATRPATIEAVMVNQDSSRVKQAQRSWESLELPVPLTILDAPYRDSVPPFMEYIERKGTESPRDVIIVYLPEYVVPHWWERILHRRTVHRLKARLRRQPGIVVASVPWQISSSTRP
ncbi:APC family permease [Rothia sp. ZJ932]|uniref:APC family permease n=1 Tax=Rothia sp. ZJ932 TaxID=2810516 RepID=UPI0019686D1E|nr:APC family permease [Rothia sp. ZJ932]QRZ60879.1 APC family permease [Rothia sp. ZJ932]